METDRGYYLLIIYPVAFSHIDHIFNLNNNTAIYINSKPHKVEIYAKIILTSTYQDLAEWEVHDNVADINICNGICQLKGHKDCMMFEVTENTCRTSKQVQKPMNKLNNDGTDLTKRTIFVSEGRIFKIIVERVSIFGYLLLESRFLISIVTIMCPNDELSSMMC